MQRPFISPRAGQGCVRRFFALGLCVVLTGCSSLPLGLGEGSGATAVQQGVAVAGTDAVALEAGDARTLPSPGPAVEVQTPPLKGNTLERFELGTALLRDGDLWQALPIFEQLTQRQPELAGPWVSLGIIHAQRGEPDKAAAAFDAALQANPHNCEARNQAALMAREQGLFSEAEQHYIACMRSQPAYTTAYRNLGILYELYMGRLTDALVMYGEYQSLLSEPDAQVAGWMSDLERRAAAIAGR